MRRCKRRSTRLKDFDYAYPGAYFVTICAQKQQPLFGEILNGKMQLNHFGEMVCRCWDDIPNHYSNVELDAFVVMPNHVHGIVMILDDFDEHAVGATHASPLLITHTFQRKRNSLGNIIGSFKSAVTKHINEMRRSPKARLWQRNYFEHIVRNTNSLNRIREYILTNPLRWQLDKENPQKTGTDEFDSWLESFGKPPRTA